jgi:hypothetical protein
MAQKTNAVKCLLFLEFQNLVAKHLVGLIGLTQQYINTEKRKHAFKYRGVRTHDPTVKEPEDSTRLRPQGHFDWITYLQP